MILTSDIIRSVQGEADAQAVYRELRKTGDFVGLARQFAFDADYRVARNALWTLTKATTQEITQLQPMMDELIDLALKTESSSVRRLSLNVVDMLEFKEEDLRSDLYDFCLEHGVDVEELPGVQAICIKIAYRISTFYPELMAELKRILEGMEIEYYKPAVKSIRSRILSGKYQ
ncbi:MAG: hypothetical protein J6P66_05115 [Bacteroidaceae bacterium]|nr:hypothetical protein [Bacteroidaceae bacterium]